MDKEKFISAWNSGALRKALAKEFGVSESTIGNWKRALGLKGRQGEREKITITLSLELISKLRREAQRSSIPLSRIVEERLSESLKRS